jgi:hypothetical protein
MATVLTVGYLPFLAFVRLSRACLAPVRMVLAGVSGKVWPGLVVSSCLTEYRKPDGQVAMEGRLTRPRDSAKALR